MKVDSAVEEYLAAKYAANLRPTTIRSYSSVLKQLLSFLRKSRVTSTENIQPATVVDYLNAKRSGGMAAPSLKLHRALICEWLRFARPEVEWAAKIAAVRVDHHGPKALTAAQCRKLLDTCEHVSVRRERTVQRRDLAVLALLIDTGLRESELCRLKLEDVDLEQRSIQVSAESKGRRERVVFFSKRTQRIVRTYLKAACVYEPSQWVWPSRTGSGGHLTPSQVYRGVKRIAALARVETTVHQLRHTFATLSIDKGIPVPHVQSLLGHRNLATTMRYVHTTADQIKRSYDKAAPVEHV